MNTHIIDDRPQSRKSHIDAETSAKKHSALWTSENSFTHFHWGEASPVYMCGQREVSYREAESLNKHILDHSGENPHSCTECKRAFWQTGSISTHLLIHTGAKLHPCRQCDKSFTQSETLNKHLLWNCFFEVCWGDGGSGVGRGDRWGCGGGYMENGDG